MALELKDEDVRRRIAVAQEKLAAPGLRSVDPAAFHMTLKFIGEVPDASVQRIAGALRGVRQPSFDARFSGMGAFPSPSRPSVVWVGVREGSEGMVALQAAVGEALRDWGREERGFKPHLTIFRVAQGARVPELDGWQDFGTARFAEFQLKRSLLTSAGPVYSDIERYGLG